MITFNFNGEAEIKHLNIRKSGADQDKVIALDVKFSGECAGPPVLQAILGAESEDEVTVCFWKTDQERNVRLSGLTACDCWAEYEGKHRMSIQRHSFRPLKIHKFKFTPKAGELIDLVFTVTVTNPTDALITTLAESVQDMARVEVSADPVLLEDAA